MLLLKDYRIEYTGVSVLYNNGNIRVVLEIDFYPFEFVLEYDTKGNTDNLNIMEFLKYSYDGSTNIRMRIPVRKRYSMPPMDCRKKKEIRITNVE